MKQIHSISEESFPISQDCLSAKKPLGQPSYLLSPEDWEDLEFASLLGSNNIVHPKFITNYGEIRYFIFHCVAYQFTEKEFQSLSPNFFFVSLDN